MDNMYPSDINSTHHTHDTMEAAYQAMEKEKRIGTKSSIKAPRYQVGHP
jgi:hypothetical protein